MTIAVDLTAGRTAFTLEVTFAGNGRVTSLFGRSGAGKTTVLNMIAGLAAPERGRIEVDGDVLLDRTAGIDVPAHRRRVGYVFQDGRLFPHLDVAANLAYGKRRTPDGDRWADTAAVVALLGLEPLLDRSTLELSGGERQRVAIGRALLASPRLLLLDEPLAGLDRDRREEVLPYLEGLRDAIRIPIVHVSHDLDEILRLADTLVLIDTGRVHAAGALNDILAEPANHDLLGRDEAGVALTATVGDHDGEVGLTRLTHASGTLSVPLLDRPSGTTVRVRIRARDVALATGALGDLTIRNRLEATVVDPGASETGMVMVRLDAGGGPLLARITREARDALALAPGLPVTALVKAAAIDNRGAD